MRSIDDLRPAPYNPRSISDEAAAGLGVSMHRFGDLSGIIWNARSGNLVCGHQRVVQLRDKGAKMIAGAVVLDGTRFPVRIVDWSEADERTANVAANNPNIAGEFTTDLDMVLSASREADAELFEALRLDELEKDPLGGELREWEAGDIEMRSMFVFRAPIETQAKIRKLLKKHMPDLDFDEEVIFG